MQNLNKKLYSFDRNYSKNKRTKKKIFMRLLIGLIILILVFVVPIRGMVSDGKATITHAKALMQGYNNQNLDEMIKETKSTRESLEGVNRWMTFLIWAGFIPVIGGYYQDARGFTGAGIEELKALEVIFKDLSPYKAEIGFTGQPGAAQDRISQAIKILDKSLPSFTKVENNFKKAKEQVENIDTNKYPENFRGVALRGNLTAAKNFIMGAYFVTNENKQALEVAPNALGQPNAKNYLLLFQNDKEIRATGGFITAFAFLKIERGSLTTTTSDDIYRLDERLLKVCESKICPLKPPDPLVRYLPETTGKTRSAWSMRDSNISPDLPTSAKEFERMYQMLGEDQNFDGIMFIDSQVVEELIEVTGPVEVFDREFSAKTDKRCNCPNVIYELESYAEIAAQGSEDRKAILGVLMSQMLAKIIGADIDKMPQFIDTVVRLANHKHIMFYMHDQKTQQALANLNWTGQIKSFDGDYLHINDSNFAGGKSNLYVEQKVTQEINIKDNKVTKKLIIDYKNPQKFNIWLNGINRDYVRFYVPKGSKLISNKGSEDPVNTIEDLDKTVFEAFITVRPENSRKLEIEYSLPYQPQGNYKLMIQKQPGAKDFEYTVKINGSQKANFKLDQDKEFKFGI